MITCLIISANEGKSAKKSYFSGIYFTIYKYNKIKTYCNSNKFLCLKKLV